MTEKGNGSIDDQVSRWVRPELQALSAYPVADAQGMLKLDAMENPNPWPGSLRDAWLAKLADIEANRYPDPRAPEVQDRIRKVMEIEDSLEVLLGNGSDELIQIIAMALSGPGRTILAPEPSFVMYRMIATFTGMDYAGVPLKADFSLDLEAMLASIASHQPALVFLALPNNPTGNVFPAEAVEAIVQASPGLVVIDEAYMAFTDREHLDLVRRYNNVVVMRTLSKVGLAGLRLGILIGSPKWLGQFEKLRLPYNINVLTQASVSFALDHYDELRDQTDRLREERDGLFRELQTIPQLEPFPSEANFILVRVHGRPAREVHESLKASGILIKCLDGAHPLLAGCLRLTVGLAEDNRRVLDALRHVLDQ